MKHRKQTAAAPRTLGRASSRRANSLVKRVSNRGCLADVLEEEEEASESSFCSVFCRLLSGGFNPEESSVAAAAIPMLESVSPTAK